LSALPEPIRVGLTGNIASGKSSVVDVWRQLGAQVVDADLLARMAMAPGTPGYAQVMASFGTADRAALRDIVFRDPARRLHLEAIIHPEVARLREEHEAVLVKNGATVIVHDIPLLFETGMANHFDLIVLVDADPATRIERIVLKRGLERTEAERMVNAQLPAEQKRNRADLVIDNNGSLQELTTRAEAAWRKIQARASA
jgi:dephospho-CoA kinase